MPIPGALTEAEKEIPPSWFFGVGTGEEGIQTVNFSQEFFKKFPDLQNQINEWESIMKGGYLDDPLADITLDKEAQGELQRIDESVKGITGFSMTELQAKKKKLEKECLGGVEASFKFNLV